jgi:hypothetical protein
MEGHLRGFHNAAESYSKQRRALVTEYYRTATHRKGGDARTHATSAEAAYESLRQLVFETVDAELTEQLHGRRVALPDVNPTLHAMQSAATHDPVALLDDSAQRLAAHVADHAFPQADPAFRRKFADIAKEVLRVTVRPSRLVEHVVANGHGTVQDATALARLLHDARQPLLQAATRRWKELAGKAP